MNTRIISRDALFILIVLLFAVHFMAFAFSNPPEWLQLAGVLGTLLFLVRIARGDD